MAPSSVGICLYTVHLREYDLSLFISHLIPSLYRINHYKD